MDIKIEKNQVVMENIGEVSSDINVRTFCKDNSHAVADKFSLSFQVSLDFDAYLDDNNGKTESQIALEFINALSKLDGCCEKGRKFRITIEQYKEVKPNSSNK